MKRTVSLILALLLTLSLCACSQRETTSPESTAAPKATAMPTATPEPTEEPAPTEEPILAYANLSQTDEWTRARVLGFVPDGTDKEASVTYAEFMSLLDHAVEKIDPDKLDEWKARFPEARQSDNVIDRGNAALAIFSAAETIGGEVYARNLRNEGQDTGDPIHPASYWGDVRREAVGFEADAPWDTSGYFIDWASQYAICRGSVLSGNPLFTSVSNNITVEESILACLRFYESAIVITDRLPTEEDAALLAEAEAKKQVILNSETDVTYTGTAYYVSNGGSDDNDGLTPETAWATIGKVMRAGNDGIVKPGDAVFFERGGIWRGEALFCAAGVTYSAYGVGEKPKIYGSEENYTGAEKWTLWYDEGGVKIWKLYRDVSEVGNIVFNSGESYATRKYAYYNGSEWVFSAQDQRPFDVAVDLTDDLTFYSTFELSAEQFAAYQQELHGTVFTDAIDTGGPLYLRCDGGNPGEIYDEIEFHQTPDRIGYVGLVIPAGDNVIDNLCVKYSARNGIAIYGEETESGNANNTIQNCEVAWTGGDQHDLNRIQGDVMVCGEGIVWKTDNNHFINNYVYQACCAGFVSEFVQGEFVPEATCAGTVISGNVMEKCQHTLFFWDNGGNMEHPEILFWDNTAITDNYVLYMGYGWSGDPRFVYGESNPNNTYHKYGDSFVFHVGGAAAGVQNMRIENNVFYLTAGSTLFEYGVEDLQPYNIAFLGNTYVENDNRNIFRNESMHHGCLTVEQIKAEIAEWLGDDAAVVLAPSVRLE